MLNLEEILKVWEKDAIVDRLEPGKELIEIPKLHKKYLKELVDHRMAARRATSNLLKMRRLKYDYYSGRLTKEELTIHGWEPFGYKTLKADVGAYIDSDEDIIKLQDQEFYHNETVRAIESIMKELNQRTWQIKEFCQWERFINGVG